MASRCITYANLRGVLQYNEIILKISPVVWSNKSNGRLAITNRKFVVYFLDNCSYVLTKKLLTKKA